MSFVALDLSVRSSGWAMWSKGQALPASGTWELAHHIDWAGRGFVRLHRNLMGLQRLDPIDEIVFEEAIPAYMLQGHTNAKTLAAAAGLAAHVMSFAEALGIRYRPVSIIAWRKHFIGSMPRGTKTLDWKALAVRRCHELGFDVQKHDAAEACGILDYQLSCAGIIPAWRESILQTELTPLTDGARV